MNWFNLSIDKLEGPLFVTAQAWEIGVWLRLIKYCVRHETGGKIVACDKWDERTWLLSTGIDKEEIMRGSNLWTWANVTSGVLVHGCWLICFF